MSIEFAKNTQTYLMIASSIGPFGATAAITREIDVLIPKYQARWNHDLAIVYARHLPLEALVSLAADGRDSKYAVVLSEKLDNIGEDMRIKSSAILAELLSAALLTAFSKATK